MHRTTSYVVRESAGIRLRVPEGIVLRVSQVFWARKAHVDEAALIISQSQTTQFTFSGSCIRRPVEKLERGERVS